MVIASEISAMQLVTRRVPKSMHRVNVMSPMMQKRNFELDPGLAAVIWIMGGIMFANFIDGIAAGPYPGIKIEKKMAQTQKISEFKLKVPEIKLLTDGSQERLDKETKDKEFCEKIKSITFMGIKAQRYNNQQQNSQQHNQQQYGKVDDSDRRTNSADDVTLSMMNIYMAKQICDNATAHSDSPSYTSNTESYSSYSYSDNSLSSDNSSASSSYGNE
jgi:hypothetical protein